MIEEKKTVEIFRLPISKQQLKSIPSEERRFLLLSSHGINQMTVLRRLLIFSSNYESPSPLESTLSAAQTQMILRYMIGSMAETWEMIKRPENQKLIGLTLNGDIETDGNKAHERLKQSFGKNNLLHKVRNSVAYHYPKLPELDAAFDAVPEDEDWSWYSSYQMTNSFYLTSELVITSHIQEVIGERDPSAAFEKLMALTIPVSDDLLDFLGYILRAIVKRHLGDDLLSPKPGSGTRVNNVPNINTVAIPFFTYRDSDN